MGTRPFDSTPWLADDCLTGELELHIFAVMDELPEEDWLSVFGAFREARYPIVSMVVENSGAAPATDVEIVGRNGYEAVEILDSAGRMIDTADGSFEILPGDFVRAVFRGPLFDTFAPTSHLLEIERSTSVGQYALIYDQNSASVLNQGGIRLLAVVLGIMVLAVVVGQIFRDVELKVELEIVD